jgi:hypothetical protein
MSRATSNQSRRPARLTVMAKPRFLALACVCAVAVTGCSKSRGKGSDIVTDACSSHAVDATVALGYIDGSMHGNPTPVPVRVKRGEVFRVTAPGVDISPMSSSDPTGAPVSPGSAIVRELCQTHGDAAVAYFEATHIGTATIGSTPAVCGCAMMGFALRVTVV